MKVLFILFQGSGSYDADWDRGAGKLIPNLKKLGDVYRYQYKPWNIFHYTEDEDHLKYDADVDFDMSYVDIDHHLDELYKKLPKGRKFIPVGASAGGYLALAFCQKFPSICCLLLDSVLAKPTTVKVRERFLLSKGDELNDKKIKQYVEKIKKTKDEKLAWQLMASVNLITTRWIEKHLKLSGIILNFVNVTIPETSFPDFTNKLKLENASWLTTQTETVNRVFVNKKHALYRDPEVVSIIIHELTKII